MTQASAAAKFESSTSARHTAIHRRVASLETRLERTIAVERKARSVVRFFESHRRLLHSKEHGVVARKTLVHAELRLAATTRQIASLRQAIRLKNLRHLAEVSPRAAICGVFGARCHEAVDVAWCESRLKTTAENGQYLGLFQMGSSERRLFGHGPTAHAQALAAHRYFVYTGSDWSPWSCKPSRNF